MNTGRDDDALRWEGDDDPTYELRAAAPPAGGVVDDTPSAALADNAGEPLALPDGFTAVGKGSDAVGHIERDGTVVMPGERAEMSNAMLITLGILGGVYSIFTIGWVIGGLRLRGVSSFLVGDEAFLPFLCFGIAAPSIWFAVTLLATRGAPAWQRIVWLIAGVMLLVPWPFVMMGALGQ